MARENKNYITPSGFNKLQEELAQLVKKERPDILKVISWAAANGDRSENADYIYGRKRLREIDKRINFLSKRLENVVIVNPIEIKSDVIKFGATILLEDEDGQEKKFSIVGIDEIDTKKRFISWKSPIGKALLGKRAGDEILVTIPKGEVEYTIIRFYFADLK